MSRIILSMETSSTMCSTALIENNNILCCIEEPTYREHNEKLPSFITTTLDNSNKTINDIDALAVGIGPGSFTGLRIGLGFCKGMAYSRGLPIIPVPTMLALAYSLKDYEPENGILFSHSKKVFYQDFKWNNSMPIATRKPVLKDIKEFQGGEKLGFHSNCGKFFENMNSIKQAIPSARNIALLAYEFYDEWVIEKPYDLVSEYIAPFEIKSSAK